MIILKTQTNKNMEVQYLKESIYKTYDELPLYLNADTVAKLFGISTSSAYELMREKDFPSVRIGKRLIVPKENLRTWVEAHIGK